MPKELQNMFLEDSASVECSICEEIVAPRYGFSFWWPKISNLEHSSPLR